MKTEMKTEMKTLVAALACVSLLAACKKEDPEPVTTPSTATVPADTTTVTPAATLPPATQDMEAAPATTTTPAPVSGADSSGSSGSSVAGMTEGSGDGMYMVERGDTLWEIAEENKINHGDLAKWNNINDPRELRVGQKLRLTAP